MEKTIYNLVILDQSGSMRSIRKEAISGFNETLQTIKVAQNKFEDQLHIVSLVVFNGTEIRTVCDCVHVADVRELNKTTYCPDSMTPLYDAIGMSIVHLRKKVMDGDKVLVTIITDGLENSSRKYSRESVSEMINELKEKGWVFTYIGANHDVEKEASRLSINNNLRFEASPLGTRHMFEKERSRRIILYSRIHSGELDKPVILDDYFSEKRDKK